MNDPPKPQISTQEADAIYRLIVELFPPMLAAAERTFRVRNRLMESGILAGTAREILFAHRERFQFFSEPDLYAQVDHVRAKSGNAAGRLKAEAEAAEKRRKSDEAEMEKVEAGWQAARSRFAGMPAEEIERRKAAAIERVSEWMRPMLRDKSPLESPMLAALMSDPA